MSEKRSTGRWLAVVLLVPVVYVLSIGPAALLYHGIEAVSPRWAEFYGDAAEASYAPVIWLTDRVDGLRDAIFWWIDLWTSWGDGP